MIIYKFNFKKDVTRTKRLFPQVYKFSSFELFKDDLEVAYIGPAYIKRLGEEGRGLREDLVSLILLEKL